jgi:RNA polymerase sigma-B factor
MTATVPLLTASSLTAKSLTAKLLTRSAQPIGRRAAMRRWQPASHVMINMSTSDVGPPGVGPTQPDLLARLGKLPVGDVRRVAIRARVIESYLPMTVYLARRYGGRGEPLADLTQVAAIGLIKALDRFDPKRGVPFASYAIPTIVGELKRHFRDTTWKIRVPRPLQELSLQLITVTEELAHALRRSPTTTELAAQLGVNRADVLAAQRCAHAYRPLSLDQPASNNEDLTLTDSLGGCDPAIEAVDTRETLRVRLAQLPERERRIIVLRYFGELTQAQIAADIGVSQMQISRLLARSLAQLQQGMLADANARVAPASRRLAYAGQRTASWQRSAS